jgi:hypothetical protein
MPNWVFNTLTIQGPKDQVDSIKNKLNSPYTKKHDNWNIETQQMEVKEYKFSNPVFAFHNIYNHIEDGVSDEIYVKQPNYALNRDPLDFSTNDWYNWNVRNWGTKWDVAVEDSYEYSETELLEHVSNGEDQWVVYRFNTAWSPPVPALEKLSALVPNCVVTLEWQEEQGFGGEIEFVKGEITSDFGYDNQCRDCDEYNTLDYCENDCGEICSKCNYLGEADLDNVKECQTHKIYLDSKHVPDYRMEQVK